MNVVVGLEFDMKVWNVIGSGSRIKCQRKKNTRCLAKGLILDSVRLPLFVCVKFTFWSISDGQSL